MTEFTGRGKCFNKVTSDTVFCTITALDTALLYPRQASALSCVPLSINGDYDLLCVHMSVHMPEKV